MLIFLISPVFAEPVDVEIDWTIEGQLKTIENPSAEESVEDNLGIDLNTINKKIQKKPLHTSAKTHEFEDLITGSGFTIGTRLITIDSEEGQILNQMLIEQRDINKDNFFHMIKYLDRYSDGYVELAEALLDPVNKQKYLSSGISYDSYIDSKSFKS